MDHQPSTLDDFYSLFLEEGVIRSKRRTQSYLNLFLNGVNFKDARVLDIGCGRGILSFFAACSGAREVIGLDPEAEGSRKGASILFERMKNPFAPTIEYHKHQAPETWVSLLEEAAFHNHQLRWTSFLSLCPFGRALAGNRVASYFLSSHFCLVMEKL